MTIRRLLPLLLVLLLAFVPGGAAQAGASGETAMAKKPPKCKVGTNRKKCRCPQGYKLKKGKKNGKKVFRCKKKTKPPADVDDKSGEDTDPGGTTDPGTTDPGTTDPGTTDPGTTDPGTTDPGGTTPPDTPAAGGERNDQALKDAFTSAAARKYVSSGGYSIYTYNFMPDVLTEAAGITFYNLRYCTFSWYPGFGNSRDNYNGGWGVKEGFTRPDYPQYPGLVTGSIYLYRQDMGQELIEAGVAVYQGEATIKTGGSKYFEEGDFSFKPGQATTDCAQWEE